MPAPVLARRAADLRGFRIAPGDSNYFACLFDPLADGVTFTLVVEIFAPGGRTPPNTHSVAEECFFVLKGSGKAHADGVETAIGPGDCFVLRPGTEHVVVNDTAEKLYCLTFMTPNEGFAELIRNGTPIDLPAEDIAVLTGAAA
ncbi:cupin domain-containing protein [Falsiroseomonas selenitidurans]|uniref:Cupin domain-containing protein n=1 Tax=Falsiroseomonas selenitidurans TaxID=2716335 RepID=A0ABX1E0Z5_9PROT|nr:cupin domain-containing protein [Falsiroseomonas selenitidurans]NKC30776.1 cupin domain-containing protein [Falsiroseomonas selenitidurans]